MNPSPVRVVVVDDDDTVRLTLRRAIAVHPELSMVGEAAAGDAAIGVIRRCAPDVVVMDITMPGMSGVDVAHRLRDERDETPIVFLSGDAAEAERVALIRSTTFLLKATLGVREILDAVRAIARPSRPRRAAPGRRRVST